VEEKVLDLSSRKRLGNLKDPSHSKSGDCFVGQLDQTESQGLRQHLGRMLERHGTGEVVEIGELWGCLFGNTEQINTRQRILKELRREKTASAAENRRTTQAVG
jgi:hypothetical protein